MLAPRVVEAFESIRKGRIFPFAWLATQAEGPTGVYSPRVRTVKVCGFNLAAKVFYLACHSAHSKLKEVAANPRAEICIVDFELGRQIRFSAVVTIQPDKDLALRERFWHKLSPRSKIELYQGHPQQPKAPASFVLLHLDLTGCELLDPPRRYRYRELTEEAPEVLDP